MTKTKFLRVLAILIASILVLLSFRMIKPSALENDLQYVASARLNVRSGPGTEYEKVGTLKRGQVIDVVSLDNGWYEINYKRKTGYVCATYVKVIDTSITTYDGEDKELALSIFNRVNEYRVSIGLQELTWSDKLYNVAHVRATEIYTNWSHTRPNGTGPDTAFAENGVKYNIASENLLRYVTNTDDSFETWYNSPSHRATMEDGDLNKSAVYVYRGPDGYLYVAQEFTD